MRTLALSLSAAALAFGGIAFAQSDGSREPQGDMTRADAQAKAEAGFDKMDANHDGVLDQADRQAMMAQRFTRLDTDGNGSLSRDEFMAAHDRAGERGQHRKGAGGRHMGPGGHHGAMGGMMLVRMADPRHTGTVTKRAFMDAALTMFDRTDANHDGTVTATERQSARQAMRAQWQAKRAARQQQN